jgi:steroid 5-alpha reductase family enzyme
MGIKFLILILVILLAAAAIIIFYGQPKNENDWVCENGMWTWHGDPNTPKASFPCGTIEEITREVPVKK